MRTFACTTGRVSTPLLTLTAAAGLVAGLLAAGAGASPAAAADSVAGAAPVAVEMADRTDLLAVTGTDGQAWTARTGGSGWTPRGGRLLGVPALASGLVDTYVIGLGTDHNVWIRGTARDWQPLGPPGTWCDGPSAVAEAGVLAVACRGADGALWVGKTPLPKQDTGLPRLTRWEGKGGALRGGVAVSGNGGEDPVEFLYSVVGTDGHPWVLADGYAWHRSNDLICGGDVGASAVAEFSACRDPKTQELWVWSIRGVTPSAYSGEGRVLGRPGVSVDPDLVTRFFVLGTDGHVWMAQQQQEYPGVVSSFFYVGGAGVGGVAVLN
jgi:hypothetical protein